MSAAGGRRWTVLLAPFICLVAALLALVWISSMEGGDATSAGDGSSPEEGQAGDTAEEDVLGDELELSDEADSTLSSLLDGDAEETSGETFLADVAALAEQLVEESPDEVAVVSWEEESDLPELAEDVLEAYEEVDGAALATSGYLDLMGNAWGAVVQGGSDWVDIVLVTTEGGTSSTVRVARLLPEVSEEEA